MLPAWSNSRIERRHSRDPTLVILASKSLMVSIRLVILVFCLVTVSSNSTNIRFQSKS